MPEYEVGSLYAKIGVDNKGLIAGLAESRAAMDATAAKMERSGARMDSANTRTGESMRQLGLASAAASVGILALTGHAGLITGVLGNLGGAVLPVLSGALTALIAPFTALTAIAVAAAGPLTVFSTVLGGIGLGAVLGFRDALSSAGPQFAPFRRAVDSLKDGFGGLTHALAQDFMPWFMKVAPVAKDVLGEFGKLANMAGKDGLTGLFKGLKQGGFATLNADMIKLVSPIGDVITRVIALAFGRGGQEGQSLIKSNFSRFGAWVETAFAPIIRWFDKQHFTATGARWASELVGSAVPVIIKGLWNAARSVFDNVGEWGKFGMIAGAAFAANFFSGGLLKTLATKGGGALLGALGGGGAASATAGAGIAADGAAAATATPLIAGLGVSLTAVGVAAAGVAGVGLAYWFMGSHTAADKMSGSVATLKGAIGKLPGDLHALAANASEAKSAFDHMNSVIKQTPNDVKKIAAAQDTYEHSLEKGVAIRQGYVKDLGAMKGGIANLIRAGQPYAGLQVRGAMATEHMSAKVADFQGNLQSALGSLGGFISKMQASHPVLAAAAQNEQAVAAAALIISKHINAIPTFKQIHIQMITDLITNREGAAAPPPGNPHGGGGKAGNPHGGGGKAGKVAVRVARSLVGAASMGANMVASIVASAKAAAPAGQAAFERIIKQIMDRMRSTIGVYGPRIVQEFQNLGAQIASAFDAQTAKMENALSNQLNAPTQAGKELAALQAAHDEAARQQAIADARTALATAQAQGDPAAILAAQQALDDALYQEQVANLEKLDAAEQAARAASIKKQKAALAEKRAEQKRHITKVLAELKAAEARAAAIKKARADHSAKELKAALAMDKGGPHNIKALLKLLELLLGGGTTGGSGGGGGGGGKPPPGRGHHPVRPLVLQKGAVQVHANVIKSDREFQDLIAAAWIQVQKRNPAIVG